MRNRGFTLLEIVLAIGLSGAVIGLLTTAINQYLIRVDASRSQVESAQLARTLLSLIADDIREGRYAEPASTGNESSQSAATTEDTPPTQGIFGTATELRIDRSAIVQWEQRINRSDPLSEDTAVELNARPADMPQTVRYVFGEGKELLTADLAAQGVSDQPITQGYAGLYRQQLPTATWIEEDVTGASTGATSNMAEMELIAPEVVEIAFAYFDGEALVSEWDSEAQEGLPVAIEIKLTVLKEPLIKEQKAIMSDLNELRRQRENLVEYRRFVMLPRTEEPAEAANSSEQGGGT